MENFEACQPAQFKALVLKKEFVTLECLAYPELYTFSECEVRVSLLAVIGYVWAPLSTGRACE